MPQKCPKCHYVRSENDHAPEWQCPKCGIAYMKFSEQARGKHTYNTAVAKAPSKNPVTFKKLRILVLLLVLFFVAMDAWLTKIRTTDWDETLRMVIYPINGDGSTVTSAYISSLHEGLFESIESFVSGQADGYGMAIREPLDVKLAPELTVLPPKPPQRGKVLETVWWSLKLRYWANKFDGYEGAAPHIRMFVVYYDPENNAKLDHSLGLDKGLIGVVNAFANVMYTGSNNVVITHEMLHTLGASDKYDLVSGQPFYPIGYADPERNPVLPQDVAEIMAGKIPLTQDKVLMPKSLNETLIGFWTAMEIGWVEQDE